MPVRTKIDRRVYPPYHLQESALTRNMLIAFAPDGGPARNLVDNLAVASPGGVPVTTRDGFGWQTSQGSNHFVDFGRFQQIENNAQPVTVMTRFRLRSTSADSSIFWKAPSSGTWWHEGFGIFADVSHPDYVLHHADGGSNYGAETANGTLQTSRYTDIAATWQAGVEVNLYLDGNIGGGNSPQSSSAANMGNCTGNLRLGYVQNLNDKAPDIIYQYFYLWHRLLSLGEMQDLDGDFTDVLGVPWRRRRFAAAFDLVPQGAANVLASESPALIQGNVVAPGGVAETIASDAPALVQANVLAVQGAAHVVASDVPALAQGNVLVVEGAAHLLAADAASPLVQGHVLAVNGAAHVTAAGNVTLSEAAVLTVGGAVHLIASDNVVLGTGINLVVGDAVNVLASDAPALVQANTLSVDDSAHILVSEALTLSFGVGLLPNDSALVVAADEAGPLVQGHVLTVEGSALIHVAGEVVLVENAVLFVPGSKLDLVSGVPGLLGGELTTPASRTYVVTSATGQRTYIQIDPR